MALSIGHDPSPPFSPHILSAFEFMASTADDPLVAAVGNLRDLALKPRKQKLLAHDTPTAFAPKRWRRYMTTPTAALRSTLATGPQNIRNVAD